MTITMLEKIGSDASLHAKRESYGYIQDKPLKQWCIMMLDDADEPEVNDDVQEEASLH